MEEILTEEELCEWLHVTRSTAWRWRKEGMPCIKYGRTVRFEKAEVLKWLKENNKEKK